MSVVVVSELRRLLSSQKPGRGAEAQLEKLENAPGFDVALLVREGSCYVEEEEELLFERWLLWLL